MSQGVYVLGGKCPGGKCLGGKCLGGKCPGGICPWGKCPGGTSPGGGYVLEPRWRSPNEFLALESKKYLYIYITSYEKERAPNGSLS